MLHLQSYYFQVQNNFRMNLTPSQILIGAVLLGGIAHVMVFFNGLWNANLWVTAALTVIIPVVIYKYMQKPRKRKRVIESL